MTPLRWSSRLSRRELLQRGARVAGAGLLAPLWPTIAATGEIGRAYPDELLSIEAYQALNYMLYESGEY